MVLIGGIALGFGIYLLNSGKLPSVFLNKDSQTTNLFEDQSAQAPSYTSNIGSKSGYVKSDIQKIRTGPSYFWCYPDQLYNIPDNQLIGFSCDPKNIDVKKLDSIQKYHDEAAFCNTEQDQLLVTYITSVDKNNSAYVNHVDLIDSNNQKTGSVSWRAETDEYICTKPVLITKEGVDFIAYFHCSYHGWGGNEVYKLNFTKGSAEKVEPKSC